MILVNPMVFYIGRNTLFFNPSHIRVNYFFLVIGEGGGQYAMLLFCPALVKKIYID